MVYSICTLFVPFFQVQSKTLCVFSHQSLSDWSLVGPLLRLPAHLFHWLESWSSRLRSRISDQALLQCCLSMDGILRTLPYWQHEWSSSYRSSSYLRRLAAWSSQREYDLMSQRTINRKVHLSYYKKCMAWSLGVGRASPSCCAPHTTCRGDLLPMSRRHSPVMTLRMQERLFRSSREQQDQPKLSIVVSFYPCCFLCCIFRWWNNSEVLS